MATLSLVGVLHWFWWVFTATEDLVGFCLARAPLRWLYDAPLSELYALSTSLKKTPEHVCMAVVESSVSVADVGRLVAWSMAMGVSEASVWDSRGDLQKNTSALREAVATEQRRLSSDAAPKPPLRLCIPGGIQETEPGFRLNILQLSDGRQDITTAAKAYTEAVCNSTANTADLTPDEFSGWLGVASSPDLVLKFGSDDFLHGLLPWQISVSEILKIRTHKHI
eukprot:gene13693-26171_t